MANKLPLSAAGSRWSPGGESDSREDCSVDHESRWRIVEYR
jgi:hypothetical protein